MHACSFADLAKILEPGKASKTDKANIISDAIRIVTQLRGENSQLRQLNKFLEVLAPDTAAARPTYASTRCSLEPVCRNASASARRRAAS